MRVAVQQSSTSFAGGGLPGLPRGHDDLLTSVPKTGFRSPARSPTHFHPPPDKRVGGEQAGWAWPSPIEMRNGRNEFGSSCSASQRCAESEPNRNRRESDGTGSLVPTSHIPPQMSKIVARKPTGAVGPSTSYAPERPRTRRGLWVVDRTPRRGRRGTARGARREPRGRTSRGREDRVPYC